MNIWRAAVVALLWIMMTHGLASATLTSGFEGQKAEPNTQVPATPQANTGRADDTLGQPNPADNASLQGRIQQALTQDPTLSTSHVVVNVTDSAIELTGTADSIRSKETAERIAESFDGNRKFADKLLVTGQSSAPRAPVQQK